MNKINVEYLLPNLTDKRKLEFLQTAKLRGAITEQEAFGFSFEEFCQAIGEYMRDPFNNQGQKRSERDMQSYYDTWKNDYRDTYFSIDDLSSRRFAWNDTLLEKIADYLAKEPLALPYFFVSVTDSIIDTFLESSNIFYYIERNEENHIFYNKRINEKEYCNHNFFAKYRLALFINIINKLLAKGINLQELFFLNLKDTRSFEESSRSNLWHTSLIQNLSEDSYQRGDGRVFSKEELKAILGYTNLEEFLDVVKHLVDIEHTHVFIPETRMLNSNNIMPVPYGEFDMAKFGDENLVFVQDICEETKRNIQKAGLEAELKVTNRKLETIKAMLTRKPKKDAELESLKSEIAALYAEIARLPITHGKDLCQALDNIVKKSGIKIKEEVPVLDNAKMQELLKRVTELESRMGNAENRIDKAESRIYSLETLVLNYLKNGGENPLDSNISNEEIIRILLQYKPENKEERVRRNKLLKSLKVSALVIYSSLLMLNLRGSTPINNVSNNTTTPVNSSKLIRRHPNIPNTFEVPAPSIEPSYPVIDETIPTESIISEPVSSEPILKDPEEIALEVIRGLWQDYPERRILLQEAGYNPEEIQSIVNDIYYGRRSLEELVERYSGTSRQ